jgi:hypothetical protein
MIRWSVSRGAADASAASRECASLPQKPLIGFVVLVNQLLVSLGGPLLVIIGARYREKVNDSQSMCGRRLATPVSRSRESLQH